jgi:hypothetical protein
VRTGNGREHTIGGERSIARWRQTLCASDKYTAGVTQFHVEVALEVVTHLLARLAGDGAVKREQVCALRPLGVAPLQPVEGVRLALLDLPRNFCTAPSICAHTGVYEKCKRLDGKETSYTPLRFSVITTRWI